MNRNRIVPLSLVSCLVALIGPAPLPAQGDKAKADKERLQGTWQVVAVEYAYLEPEDVDKQGMPTKFKAVNKSHPPHRLKYDKWIFKGAEFVKQSALGPGNPFEFRLDATKAPMRIVFDEIPIDLFTQKRLPEKGDRYLVGIYRLEGDTLTVCMNDVGGSNRDPRGPRPESPASFQPKPDEQTAFSVFRLKRYTPEAVSAKPRPTTPPEGLAAVIAADPKLLALARQRREAALQEWEGRLGNISIGKATPDLFLLEASARLLRASLDLARSREEQEAMMEEHLAKIYMIEDMEETKYRVGKDDITVFAPIRHARLDLELRLEMFRLKPPPKK